MFCFPEMVPERILIAAQDLTKTDVHAEETREVEASLLFSSHCTETSRGHKVEWPVEAAKGPLLLKVSVSVCAQ